MSDKHATIWSNSGLLQYILTINTSNIKQQGKNNLTVSLWVQLFFVFVFCVCYSKWNINMPRTVFMCKKMCSLLELDTITENQYGTVQY